MRLSWRVSSAATSVVAALGVAAPTALGLTWSAPVPVARSAPYIDYGPLTGVSCPSARLCVAVDGFGNVVTSAAPATGPWTAVKVLSGRLDFVSEASTRAFDAVSCPAAHACIAADNHGDLITSRDPIGAASAWRILRPTALRGSHADSLSCPSTRFCAAALSNGGVAISTDPLGGAHAWRRFRIPRRDKSTVISCPSRRLCIGGGYAMTPKHAATSLLVRRIRRPKSGIVALSCPSSGLCVGIDGNGHMAFVRLPSARNARWRTTSADFIAYDTAVHTSIECQSVRFCAAGILTSSFQPQIVTSTRPTGSAAAWRPVKFASSPAYLTLSIPSVSCPSRALCVGVDDHGEALSSTRPASRSQTWNVTGIDGGNSLSGVSCAGPSVCVAVGDGPADMSPVWASTTDPTGPANAWLLSRTVGGTAIACPTASLCVGTDERGEISTATDPTNVSSGFSTGQVLPSSFLVCPDGPESCPDNVTINHLACASASLCVGFGLDSGNSGSDGPYASSSTDPAGGSTTWATDAPPSFVGGALSCPSATLCVAVGVGEPVGGEIATTSTPTNGGSWVPAAVDIPDATLTGISCPSVSLCVAADTQGNVLSSTNPTNPSSWVTASIDPGHVLNGVACGPTSQCVAFDNRGTAFQSSSPTTAGSWSATSLESGLDVDGDPIELTSGSCPTDQLCVLTDSVGNIIYGTS